MYLHEYQSKRLLFKYGLVVPLGYTCQSSHEIIKSISQISKGSFVLKCQIHSGGRGKSGGVDVVSSKKDVLNFSNKWFKKKLVTYQTNNFGQIVNYILIESSVDILKEIYLGVLIDRTINSIVFIASLEGGIEIENTVSKKTSVFHKVIIDPIIGPQLFQGRSLAYKLNLTSLHINLFADIFMKLVLLFVECDLELIEINPLVITKDNIFICLDCKIIIDNNAFFRQNLLFNLCDLNQENKYEIFASSYDLNYISLHGNIGCMVNGAGLAMGTMDMIHLYGGKPANFLDIGGGISEDRVIKAFKVILSDKNVKVILVNIFGGIVRCNLVSAGIIKVMLKYPLNIPIVIRLEGNNSKLGIQQLLNSGLNIINATTLVDAIKKVIFILGK